MNRPLLVVPLLGLVFAAACAASGKNSGFDVSDEGGAPLGDGGSSGALGTSDGPAPTAPSGAPLLYAHTDTTLYQLDPEKISGGSSSGSSVAVALGIADIGGNPRQTV